MSFSFWSTESLCVVSYSHLKSLICIYLQKVCFSQWALVLLWRVLQISLLPFRVSCESAADKAAYLNQWTGPSEYNQVVIEWHTAFDEPLRKNPWAAFFPSFAQTDQANNKGWSLEYQIGCSDEDGNFGKHLFHLISQTYMPINN